jgi:uncharacterized protein (TIGR03437 family)
LFVSSPYWVLLALAGPLAAQPSRPYRIDTVAGTNPISEGIAATNAVIGDSPAIAVGKDGAIYVSSITSRGEGIRKILGDGIISRVPGAGVASGIVVDSSGRLSYIIGGGPELYTQDPNGPVVTTAPSDGVGFTARFAGIALDRNGDVLLADQGNRRVVSVAPNGTFKVVAGLGSRVSLTSGPNRLAVDSLNNVYIAQQDGRITRLSADGTLTVVAGNGGSGAPIVGGPATGSPFGRLGAVAVTDRGEVFVTDVFERVLLRVTTTGTLESVIRNVSVSDLALDINGDLLFAESTSGRIWRVRGDGTQTLVAGRDRFDGDDGPGTKALLKSPAAIVAESVGTTLIGDTGNNRIRKLSPDGVITTVAGTGDAGNAGDGGAATAAQVFSPNLLALDKDGNLYLSCRSCTKIRRLKAGGTIETFAGSDEPGNVGDGGLANSAKFQSIGGLAVDRGGRLFVSDTGANRIRLVGLDGKISTYAGTGERAFGGEGARATAAPLSDPAALAVDSRGNLVVFESGRIRQITPSGIITSLTQTGFLGTPGNQDAGLCSLPGLSQIGLTFDLDDTLLVGLGSVICRLMPDATSWLVAGGRQFGFAGDGGPGLSALLTGASGLAVDPGGAIYFTDTGNHRVRRLTPENSGAVALLPAIRAVQGAAGSSLPVTQMSSSGMYSIYGTDFADSRIAAAVKPSDLVNGSLPTKLADTCVEVGGQPAFLTFVGSRQINFQSPEIPIQTQVSVQVTANCGMANEVKSGLWTMPTRAATPEFLYWIHDGREQKPVIAVNAVTNEYLGAPGLIPGLEFRPAKPGELVTIYCISLGATNPPVSPGLAATGTAAAVNVPAINIGGLPLPASNLLYAGMTPGIAGLYQLNIRLPDLPDGDQRIFVVGMVGSPSDGFITVKRQ